jgi:hypothetical protein
MPEMVPDLGIVRVERVTGIEPALSAWEAVRLRPIEALTCRFWGPGVPVADT